ncbi:hypothetical protein [Streptacidiphilus anmyonensis]|uniref:hypothetical protein n=1 Tax=Streptacidiphilus anmyonensis TaxID=405782 RepID=UPI001364ABC0|nr:hypothetical protein [Streptacidiphilus anmyonensis]
MVQPGLHDTGKPESGLVDAGRLRARVHAGGVAALEQVLLHFAAEGSRTEAAAADLIRALPDLEPSDATNVLGFTRIREEQRLVDLTPWQRGALAVALAHMPTAPRQRSVDRVRPSSPRSVRRSARDGDPNVLDM